MITGNQLHIGGKTYVLSQIVSVQAATATPPREEDGLYLVMAGGGAVMLILGMTMSGDRNTGTVGAVLAVLGLIIGLTGLLLSLNRPTLHVAVITTSAGDRDQITFPTADACRAFCDELSATITATGASVNVDARAVHLHVNRESLPR